MRGACHGICRTSIALAVLVGGGWPVIASAEEARVPDFERLERRQSPAATFTANQLGIVHMEVTRGFWPLSRTYQWWRATSGNYRQPVTYPDFLRAVGRADLAESYEHRQAVADVCAWTGAAMLLGGAGVFVWGLVREAKTPTFVGAGVFLAGGLLWNLGGGSPEPGLTEAEAVRLADEYNQALRVRLGLGIATARRAAPIWRLAPLVGASHLGVVGMRAF